MKSEKVSVQALPYPANLRLSIFWIYGPAILFLVAIAVFHQLHAIPFRFFFRDPTVTLQGHPLTGISSNLGVILWFITGGICIFSSQLIYRSLSIVRASKIPLFLRASGLLTLTLAVDDLFLLHDNLFPQLLGVDGKFLLLAYAMICAAIALKFRHQLNQSCWGLLLTALVFFMASLIVDRYQSHWDSAWRIFFEDGFKLLGVFSWSGYFIRTCFRFSSQVLEKNG